jgi:heptosyltransferase-1
MKKVLVIKLTSLGDIVHLYPAIYDLKQKINDISIDWVVDKNFEELIEINNLVDNVISIPLRKWKHNLISIIPNILNWKNQLKEKDYDYIIDAQGLIKSSIISRGTVFGFDRFSVKEKLSCLFYDKKINIPNDVLAISKNRKLFQEIFNYKINLNEINFGINTSDLISKNDQVNYYSKLSNKYVIFFHATSRDSKKYDINSWKILAEYLINNYRYNIVLPYGNNKELLEAKKIKEIINHKNVMVPEKILSYKDLSVLISNSNFVFGVDTGLVHLANALNKPLIAIYVDTNPKNTGVFETKIAKNIGDKENYPSIDNIIKLYEQIKEN